MSQLTENKDLKELLEWVVKNSSCEFSYCLY